MELQIAELAEQILAKLSAEKKGTIAINEFLSLKGETSDLGRYLAEELTTRIINSGKANVVERRLMKKVLAEQEIGASQLVDDETAARIGKILGADTLCTGTITDLGQSAKVNARLIDAESAAVFAAAGVQLHKSGAVVTLLGQQPVAPARTFAGAPAPAPARARPAQQHLPPQQPPQQPAALGGDDILFVGKASGGEGPDTLVVKNKTKYCVKLWINGRSLRAIEQTREVPCLPRGDKAFYRLGGFGEYRVQASGSGLPSPYQGIVGYDKQHLFTMQRRPVIVLEVDDFYSTPAR